MIVMPANNAKWQVHYWQGLYGGLGHLYGPGNVKGPYPHLPYVLDNGAFPAWTNGRAWDEQAWLDMIKWASDQDIKPTWVLVPDVVTDPVATIERWHQYAPIVNRILPEVPLAFAVQDGHTSTDVPAETSVVFIGGSTEWKWKTVGRWCAEHQRVHVGRVNGYQGLRICEEAGAESCDGTGWFRGDADQLRGLERFLAEQAGGNGRRSGSPSSVVRSQTDRGRTARLAGQDHSLGIQTTLFEGT